MGHDWHCQPVSGAGQVYLLWLFIYLLHAPPLHPVLLFTEICWSSGYGQHVGNVIPVTSNQKILAGCGWNWTWDRLLKTAAHWQHSHQHIYNTSSYVLNLQGFLPKPIQYFCFLKLSTALHEGMVPVCSFWAWVLIYIPHRCLRSNISIRRGSTCLGFTSRNSLTCSSLKRWRWARRWSSWWYTARPAQGLYWAAR